MSLDLVLAALALLVTQVAAGLVVWRWLDPDEPAGSMRLAAAIVVGPGAITLQMFALHALGLRFSLPALALPWWLLCLWPPQARPRAGVPLPGSLLALVLVVTIPLAVGALSMPIHEGDAVNNFTLYAKVFGTLGDLAPQRLLALADAGHVEYPHLVALTQSWFFTLDPDSGPWTARGVEALGGLACALLVAHAAARVASRKLAFGLAACVLLAPEYLRHVANFADVRLAATFLLLGTLALRLPGGDRRTALAFAFVAGTGALTKNEGVAVGAGALALLAWTARRRVGVAVPALALGIAMLVAWPLVRARIGLSAPWMDEYLGRGLGTVLAQVPAVLWNWVTIAFGAERDPWPRWGVAWVLLGAVAIHRARSSAAARAFLGAFAAHLAVYTVVLAATRPEHLEGMLATAANRLLLHTMPWVLLAAVSGVVTPPPPAESAPG